MGTQIIQHLYQRTHRRYHPCYHHLYRQLLVHYIIYFLLLHHPMDYRDRDSMISSQISCNIHSSFEGKSRRESMDYYRDRGSRISSQMSCNINSSWEGKSSVELLLLLVVFMTNRQ